jgi:hypothetical protein
MFQVQAPVIIVPTAEARQAIGDQLRAAALATYREIARQGKGLEIAYLQFAFDDLTLAVCSRIRRDGFIEIELALGDPRRVASTITAKQLREATARAHARQTLSQRRH